MYTRKPIIAGQFYNDEPDELRKEVLAYLNINSHTKCHSDIHKYTNNLDDSDSSDNTKSAENIDHQSNNTINSHINEHKNQACENIVSMLLLPHAGHVYCGAIIGKTLAQAVLAKNIIILCPNHRGMGERLAIWPKGEWLTPLGAVKVNSSLAQTILDSHPSFKADTKAHELEHSIEVLLPFLQCHSPKAQIVPISVSIYDFKELDSIAKNLAKIISHANKQNDDISIIVSSDMNHFEGHEKSAQKDALALTEFINCRPEALLNVVVQNKISMCGISPAVLGLSSCFHNKKNIVKIVEYTNSAKINNNYASVVGYCGAIVQ